MTGRTTAPARPEILGVAFDLIDAGAAIATLRDWRRRRRGEYVAITNPYSVLLCRRDPAMLAATRRAGLVLPDGVGIILAAELLGYRHAGRVTGPSLMLEVCDRGRAEGWGHYFYGGAPGVADRLARRLAASYPGLSVAGTHCPPFRPLSPAEEADDVRRINAARPDVVWVGLGAPKQEKWMHRHVGHIAAPAMIGVGAAFDFHSGNVRWAPQWIRRAGLEWAYRLAAEPRRLWRRSVLGSPAFLWGVLRQRSGRAA